MARLKVFVTSDGLTDYVVAASSRPKALAAWGVRQDLFKQGRARETDDAALRDAAVVRPGEVLRRPTGAKVAPVRRKPAPREPSKAALARVAALERRLTALEASDQAAQARFDDERRRLEAKAAEEQTRRGERRAQAQAALRAARRAVRGR